MRRLLVALSLASCLSTLSANTDTAGANAVRGGTVAVKYTEAEAREFIARWFPAWVGGVPSVEKLLAFYTPDATYVDPNRPRGIRGTAALRAFFTEMLGNFPDWSYRIVAIYPTAKGFILNWSADIPYKGKVIRDFRGVDVLEINDKGLITKHEDYFDLSVFRL